MARTPWTAEQLAIVRRLYPHTPTRDVAKACGHSVTSTYQTAYKLGLLKSREFLASPASGIMIPGTTRGAAYRFPKGHVPANKGVRRPGWAPGRMRETQFKPGHYSTRWDHERYHVGALRENADGIIDIKLKEGPRAWRALHVVLWEDANGPVPAGHVLAFRDRDRLNVELENLELITRAELCRRNSVHNLPAPLRSAIQVLGQLKRRIRERHEKQTGGSAQSPDRHTGSAA